MKRRFAIFNLALMALVQLTMGWQSFHAFSHKHHHSVAEKHVKHFGIEKHSHDSHEDDDCSVCDFHFDFFVAPQQFCLTLTFPHTQIPYTYSSIEGHAAYTGSLFALRAPPVTV
jgi:hypothetical protein